MMNQKFDQQWITRRTEPTVQDQEKMLRLLEPTETAVEIAHDGATIRMQDLLALHEDDLLLLDLPADRPTSCLVNGKERFQGRVAQFGSQCVFVVDGVSSDS
jgi:flagellar motor switch protein FliM